MSTPKENLKKDLLESIVDTETGEAYDNPNEGIMAFFGHFKEEFNDDFEVHRWPYLADRVSAYLRMRPSCIGVAFEDYTIERELMPKYGYSLRECLVDNYFTQAGEALVSAYIENAFPEENKRPPRVERMLYYHRDEARKAAQTFADEYGGHFGRVRAMMDDHEPGLQESESFATKVGPWCGTVSAFVVLDKHGQTLGKFGWWTDSDDDA